LLASVKHKRKLKSQNNNETIGDKIKQLRNKQGLTQDELARKSEIPYTTLTKIETNVITKPTIQTVIKIAQGFGVSLDDLME
jgi:transcriptional regulator with XRE-family HTH domain